MSPVASLEGKSERNSRGGQVEASQKSSKVHLWLPEKCTSQFGSPVSFLNADVFYFNHYKIQQAYIRLMEFTGNWTVSIDQLQHYALDRKMYLSSLKKEEFSDQ
jgi:hypothetical protein